MEKNKKVELLAPAGNYECFLAAIHAGADAVYLAGNRFGARAYADNFTTEQLVEAIQYAHLLGRKVYMTVNTLLKPDEAEELVAYMIPYYEAGLDGVIIQDLGVFSILKRHFPGMELHCSTQMTLTGPEGAAFAQSIGATRIVPAREISLSEIRQIHEAYPDLELECFIHGALCYCYSGQCLFSSIVGGRSGNRGTCAQPCRLPYDVYTDHTQRKEAYPLSLKDLNTIHMIPELIEAGIASFKIEGRMKSAEYVAGVTGIYRAAIDRYLAAPEKYQGPTKAELAVLSELYVRSETEEGYYHHYNGKHMITPDKPSYIGCSDETIAHVRATYMQEIPTLPLTLYAMLKKDQPAVLTVSLEDGRSITANGDIVSTALNKPLTEADVHKQLKKTGGTVFSAEQIMIDMDSDIFMPVSRLNELRRLALESMKELLLAGNKRRFQTFCEEKVSKKEKDLEENADEQGGQTDFCVDENNSLYTVCVRTKEQLEICLKDQSLSRIYVEDSLWQELIEEPTEAGKAFFVAPEKLTARAKNLYYALPRILRKKNRDRVSKNLRMLLEQNRIAGAYVATPDAYELAKQILSECGINPKCHIIAAPSLAVMNQASMDFWQKRCKGLSVPLELNEKELRALLRKAAKGADVLEMMVYGRIPLMFTANCIRKSFDKDGCSRVPGISFLKDRKQNRIPVIHDCVNCCNIIYNSVPLSLHKHLHKLEQLEPISNMLLSFTTETAQETADILAFYHAAVGENDVQDFSVQTKTNSAEWAFGEYTNGHFARGVV